MFMSESIYTFGGYTRVRFLEDVLQRIETLDKPVKILEIGCGNANFLKYLDGRLKHLELLVGVDLNASLLEHARNEHFKHPCSLFSGDVLSIQDLTGESFDVIFMFDVLEHIERDDEFLASLHERLLASGGRVVIGVPAHMWLWSYVDELMGHHRRYEKRSMLELIRGSGYEVESFLSFGTFTGLLTPLAFRHLLRGRRSKAATKESLTTASGSNYIPAWYKRIYPVARAAMPFVYAADLLVKGTSLGNQYLVVAKKKN